MSNKNLKPFMLATGALLLGGIAVSQSAFAVKQLGNGYQVTTPDDGKAAEGKCGEGKCGADKTKMAEGTTDKTKLAEGKCGEGKCGEGKCGADKTEMAADASDKTKLAEGKCGEGKCGEGKCGADMHKAKDAGPVTEKK